MKNFKCKKNMKIIAIIAVIAALVIGAIIIITAYIGNGQKGIVGSWANQDGNIAFEFYEDGSVNGGGYKYYEASESGVLTFYDSYHYPYNDMYYKIEGNKLYIARSRISLDEAEDYYIRQ